MTASYRITIEPLGKEVSCREDQSVLDACLRAGVWLPHWLILMVALSGVEARKAFATTPSLVNPVRASAGPITRAVSRTVSAPTVTRSALIRVRASVPMTANTTPTVNQQVPPGSFLDANQPWQDLGVYTITSNSLVVSVSDNADGNVEPLVPNGIEGIWGEEAAEYDR